MKKILSILLSIAFIGAFGQAKISQLPTTTPLTGAELIPVVQGGVTKQTTATQISTFVTSAVSGSYVPYTAWTGSVNGAANTLSIGIIKSASVAVASPSNGWQWYDPTLNAFTWYHNSNGSTYSAVFTNSVFGLGIYNVASTSGLYNCQFVTTNTAGIALSPNGNIVLGVSTNSVYSTKRTHIGGSTDISHTLQVSGGAKITTTLSVGAGSGTVITGNSGTVSVLSDVLSSLGWNYINFNISDGATYYFGNMNYPPQSFAATMGTVELQYNCTLVGWSFNYYLGGTTGSGESATLYIRANNTTDTQLSNSITFNSATATGFSASGLSNNFNAGDRINMKLVCPTYATNPTQAYFGITLFFVRRQ